jgi:hypothetical protein
MANPEQRESVGRFRRNLLWIGIAGLVLGTGPLVVAVLWSEAHGDPNPNPVGPGICAMFTFWPSIVLIVVGLVDRWRSARGPRDPGPRAGPGRP